MAKVKWPCRFCGKRNKTMSRRRIHEHVCSKRPEVIASQEYVKAHPKEVKQEPTKNTLSLEDFKWDYNDAKARGESK